MRPRPRRALRRLLGRPEPTAFLESDRVALDARLDLTRADLARLAEGLRGWREAERHEVRTVQWLVPPFAHAAYGGVFTILRLADGWARAHGVQSAFHVHDADAPTAAAVGERIAAAFPALAGARVTSGDPAALPPCDAAIATFWPTAYALARLHRARARFWLVQDDEALFYAAGAASALARQATALGFPAILNSPALEGRYPTPLVTLTPSVDRGRFHPPAAPRPGEPFRVVFYGRPSASRNAFGLGLAVLQRVKQAHGARVELLAAGEAWDPRRYGLPAGVVENLGLLGGLDAVADLYRSAHAGLFFMMTPHTSYQPLELLACGAACVSNENPSTAWLLEHERTALLAPPLPSLVAEQVGRLVEDPALRERLAGAGRARVEALPGWDAEVERVFRALTKADVGGG